MRIWPGWTARFWAGRWERGRGADVPPGVYTQGARSLAVNVVTAQTVLAPAEWPAGQAIEGMQTDGARDLKGVFIGAALVLVLGDILAALWLSGRLGAAGGRVAAIALALALAVPLSPRSALAQDSAVDPARDDIAIAATEGVVLAYVRTGDAALDDLSAAGLLGLSDRLTERTSIEPLLPMGVDIETDELAFFPFLYWPVSPGQGAAQPARL